MLTIMSTLGLLYAVPVVPRVWAEKLGYGRLKDIPSSKTIALSGGWACCLGLVPALSPQGGFSGATILVCLVIFFLVFIRSALSDIIEIQGDRIAGRETIPIIIGEKNTLTLLGVAVGLLVVTLVGGWLVGALNSLALVLLLCAGYALFYLVRFRGDQIMGNTLTEALIDADFILAGLLSLIWALAGGAG